MGTKISEVYFSWEKQTLPNTFKLSTNFQILFIVSQKNIIKKSMAKKISKKQMDNLERGFIKKKGQNKMFKVMQKYYDKKSTSRKISNIQMEKVSWGQ